VNGQRFMLECLSACKLRLLFVPHPIAAWQR
jgi:hypothetical protein